MSALDSPNLTAGQTRIPGLATKQWVQQRANLWGPDNPLYQARILGQFPTQTQDALINLTHLETATRPPAASLDRANQPLDLPTRTRRRQPSRLPPCQLIPNPLSTVIPPPSTVIPPPSTVIPTKVGIQNPPPPTPTIPYPILTKARNPQCPTTSSPRPPNS